MICAVIFDLDNTLYDYDLCNEYAEKMLYEKIHKCFNMTVDQAAYALSESKKIVKKRLGNTAASHNRLLYMQTLCENAGKNSLIYAKEMYDCYWNEMLSKMHLYEYVIPLLIQLKDKQIKTAILTDLTAYIQYRKLEKLGLLQYIDFLVTSEEVGEEKPSAKMYDLVLKKIGCRPEEALMIGDDYEKDILGARRMGMATIQYMKDKNMIKEVAHLI